MTRAMLAALLLAIPSAASAQDQPMLQPSRDVVVTYRVEGAAAGLVPGGAAPLLTLSWSAAAQRLRVEAAGRPQVLLVDLPAGRAEVLDPGMRAALALPVRPADLQAIRLDGARLTRRGQGSAAGLACTDYAVRSSRGTGMLCLTADGVALRGDGAVDGKHGAFTATAVQYGTLPPSLFEVPPGMMQLNLPMLPR